MTKRDLAEIGERLSLAEADARETIARASSELAAIDHALGQEALAARFENRSPVDTGYKERHATLSLEIAEARAVLDAIDRRRREHRAAEAAHDARDRFHVVKQLLDQRLELAAELDRAAAAFGAAEAKINTIAHDLWLLIGADRDATHIENSKAAASVAILPARKAMRRHGSNWAYPVTRFDPAPVSAADATAQANNELRDHLRQRLGLANTAKAEADE